MEVTKIKEAYRLLEKYEKLGKFISEAPDDADMLTLTLRKGSASKSLSLRNIPNEFDVIAFAKEQRADALVKMKELGIQI